MNKRALETKISISEHLRIIIKDMVKNRSIYLLAIPGIIYFIVFKYLPMYGIIISFKDFSPRKGIIDSEWVGLKHFVRIFTSMDFKYILRNTVTLNVLRLITITPIVIVFALMLNEIRTIRFKKIVQTISYFPHFLSWVVVSGIVFQLFAPQSGSINKMLVAAGMQPLTFLSDPDSFRWLIIITGAWKEIGWDSIIYIAAMAGINQELYEAAKMDGAGKLKQIFHVTIPGILPTILTLLLIRIGHIMSVGFEQIYVFLNPMFYQVGDVFATYIYRVGLGQGRFSYTTAIGLFNSLVGFGLLYVSNRISRKVAQESLW